MDYEFWLRIGRNGARFYYLPEYLAASRLYPENKTIGKKMAVHLEINDMLKQRLGHVPDSWLYSYAHYLVAKMGISRKENEGHFLFEVASQSLQAAWRWNTHGKVVYRSFPSLIHAHSTNLSWQAWRWWES